MNDPLDLEMGERLKNLREKEKLTQTELGDEVGVSFQQIQKYESGVNRISVSRLVKIARALDTTASKLLRDMK